MLGGLLLDWLREDDLLSLRVVDKRRRWWGVGHHNLVYLTEQLLAGFIEEWAALTALIWTTNLRFFFLFCFFSACQTLICTRLCEHCLSSHWQCFAHIVVFVAASCRDVLYNHLVEWQNGTTRCQARLRLRAAAVVPNGIMCETSMVRAA